MRGEAVKVSTQDQAALSKTTHSFHPGMGYFDWGCSPPLTGTPVHSANKCQPKAGTAEGSHHMLLSGGGRLIRMAWVAREQAWERGGGIRMAFTCAYLAHHGWKYQGPVT
jgi:hypothetical protein